MKILKFGADWCTSCKTLNAVMETWEDATRSKVEYVDVDKNRQSAKDHRIMTMPTVLVLDETGNEVARYTGGKITESAISAHI